MTLGEVVGIFDEYCARGKLDTKFVALAEKYENQCFDIAKKDTGNSKPGI